MRAHIPNGHREALSSQPPQKRPTEHTSAMDLKEIEKGESIYQLPNEYLGEPRAKLKAIQPELETVEKAQDSRKSSMQPEAKAWKQERRLTAWQYQKASLRRIKARGIDVTNLELLDGKLFRIVPWFGGDLTGFAMKGRLTFGGGSRGEEAKWEVARVCLLCLELRGSVAKQGLYRGESSNLWAHIRREHREEMERRRAGPRAHVKARVRAKSCLVWYDEEGLVPDKADEEQTASQMAPVNAMARPGSHLETSAEVGSSARSQTRPEKPLDLNCFSEKTSLPDESPTWQPSMLECGNYADIHRQSESASDQASGTKGASAEEAPKSRQAECETETPAALPVNAGLWSEKTQSPKSSFIGELRHASLPRPEECSELQSGPWSSAMTIEAQTSSLSAWPSSESVFGDLSQVTPERLLGRLGAEDLERASLQRLSLRGIHLSHLDVGEGRVFRALPWTRITSSCALRGFFVKGQVEDLDKGSSTAHYACLLCLEAQGFAKPHAGLFCGVSTSSATVHLMRRHKTEAVKRRCEPPRTPEGPFPQAAAEDGEAATKTRAYPGAKKPEQLDPERDLAAQKSLEALLKGLKERGVDVDWLEVGEGLMLRRLPWERSDLARFAVRGQVEGAGDGSAPTRHLACLLCLSAAGFVRQGRGLFAAKATSALWYHLRRRHPKEAAALRPSECQKAPGPVLPLNVPEEYAQLHGGEANRGGGTGVHFGEAELNKTRAVKDENVPESSSLNTFQAAFPPSSAKSEAETGTTKAHTEQTEAERLTRCPLCSAVVSSEGFESHLKLELAYFPVRCTLCACRFPDWPTAEAHFMGRFARHRGERLSLAEVRDWELERRLEELLERAHQ